MAIKKKALRLAIAALLTVIFAYLTTFGWRFWPSHPPVAVCRDQKLADRLRGHVWKLSADIGDRSAFKYKALNQAADYIAKTFSSFGYKVESQEFIIDDKAFRNIIAVKKGGSRPDEVIVVAAHYDTFFNKGADDNASGVSVVLELAGAFAGREAERTVKFIAFVNEEPPFFNTGAMGSRVYVARSFLNKEDIRGVYVFEMVGYYTGERWSQRYPPLIGMVLPSAGYFIAAIGNFPSRNLLRLTSRVFRDKSPLKLEALVLPSFAPGLTLSDHYSFWLKGYPAIIITDTSFYRYPYYHTNSDTYDKLNYPYMAELVMGFTEAVSQIADAGDVI